jgi:hypothetical protein
VSIGVQGEDYTKETVCIPPERQVSLPISGGHQGHQLSHQLLSPFGA